MTGGYEFRSAESHGLLTSLDCLAPFESEYYRHYLLERIKNRGLRGRNFRSGLVSRLPFDTGRYGRKLEGGTVWWFCFCSGSSGSRFVFSWNL